MFHGQDIKDAIMALTDPTGLSEDESIETLRADCVRMNVCPDCLTIAAISLFMPRGYDPGSVIMGILIGRMLKP